MAVAAAPAAAQQSVRVLTELLVLVKSADSMRQENWLVMEFPAATRDIRSFYNPAG